MVKPYRLIWVMKTQDEFPRLSVGKVFNVEESRLFKLPTGYIGLHNPEYANAPISFKGPRCIALFKELPDQLQTIDPLSSKDSNMTEGTWFDQHRGRYNTDKHPIHLEVYATLFGHQRDKIQRVFEIGIRDGGSLLMFKEYFPNATIMGIDKGPLPKIGPDLPSIHMRHMDQSDAEALQDYTAGCTFDLVIDDACHFGAAIEASFNVLFPLLRLGGYYIIEDWGVSYYYGFSDPPLPFLKGLVDRCGMAQDIKHVGFYTGDCDGYSCVIQKR